MNPILLSLTLILTAHWLSDFVYQTDWQAKNKSSNWRALIQHVAVYMIGTTILGLALTVINAPIDTGAYATWIWVNTLAHLATDAVTSRINTRLWNAGRVHDFFVSVGFDQLIHQLTLIGTFFWLFVK